MKHLTKLVFVLALFIAPLISNVAKATMKEGHEMPKMPAEFEKMKSLVGDWESVVTEDGKEMKAIVSYELTSAGSAVVEKLFKGTPHEMTTVYYADGNTLGMTHYCALGNHPKMVLKKSGKDNLFFEMKGNDGIKSAKEAHMHALTITFKDNNTIQHDWVYYEDGKKIRDTVIIMTRKI